jgi:hypothetical protein
MRSACRGLLRLWRSCHSALTEWRIGRFHDQSIAPEETIEIFSIGRFAEKVHGWRGGHDAIGIERLNGPPTSTLPRRCCCMAASRRAQKPALAVVVVVGFINGWIAPAWERPRKCPADPVRPRAFSAPLPAQKPPATEPAPA